MMLDCFIFLVEIVLHTKRIRMRNKQSLERRSRRWSGRTWNSLPSTDPSKCIYTWTNSHRKPAGNWQKESCTTKAVRKIQKSKYNWVGREVISQDCARRRDTEEEGDYAAGGLLWGANSESHRFTAPILVSHAGEMSPRLVGGPEWLTGGKWVAWTLLRRSVGMLACSQNRAGRVNWKFMGGYPVSHDCPSLCAQTELSECSSP